jgi:hypothetical protein
LTFTLIHLLETVENGKYTDSYWYRECCDQLNPFETRVTESYVMLTSIIFFLLPFLLSSGLFIRWYDNNVLIRIESTYTSKIKEGEIMMETEKFVKKYMQMSSCLARDQAEFLRLD